MNRFLAIVLLAVLPLVGSCGQSPTAPATVERTPPGDPRIALAAKIPGAKPEDLRPSPLPGLYELSHDADVSYISADGKFIISGDLYQVPDKGSIEFPNLTENRRRELRGKLLAGVPDAELISFGAPTLKHSITVFTDVDCTWCRKLHSQIAEYNKAGIRVRYMAWPRTGPATESWEKAETVWCAKDKADALSRAKRGEAVRVNACAGNPVQRHWDLGRKLGVEGTPGVLLPSGELLPGYVPPLELAEHLNRPRGG